MEMTVTHGVTHIIRRSSDSSQRPGRTLFVIDKRICFGKCVAGKDRQMPERRRETPGAGQNDINGRNR
jgi:hypothetical protein